MTIIQDHKVEARTNIVKERYEKALGDFQENFASRLSREGVFDYSVISTIATEEITGFLAESGLIKAMTNMIDLIVELADLSVAEIPDKGLKRTIMRIAKSNDFKIVDIRELVAQLSEGNAEAEFTQAQAEFLAIKNDYEVAVRLSHQYDALKVPKALVTAYSLAKDTFDKLSAKYPHLVK